MKILKHISKALSVCLVINLSIFYITYNSNAEDCLKRKVIINTNKKNINSILQNVRHEKVKDLVSLSKSLVCMISDRDAEEIENKNPDVKVYDDCTFKVPKVKGNNSGKRQVVPWGVEEIKADEAWKLATGKNIRVAVLDSGIDYKHPDLHKNIKGTFNAIDNTKSIMDDYGHGTHVSGIIAAENNNQGMVGVSPNVDLYSVKVLDQNGEGNLSDLADGIEWCVNNKIQIINMSFGIPQDMPLLYESITKAINSGIIVVAAAGNEYGGPVDYPAAYKEVISVSAIDKNFSIADFSSKGKVDFCAPGVDIYSTYPNSSYEYLSGSSMATPYVTGTIALLLQTHNKYTKKDIINILASTSKDLGIRGKDDYYGFGLINTYKSCTK